MPEGHKVVTKTLSMFRDSRKTNTSQSDSLTQLSRVYQVSPIQPAVIAFTQAHLQAASFNTTIGILALRLEIARPPTSEAVLSSFVIVFIVIRGY